MNFLNPIYTEKRECQDCYKCVRNCPVKAIKVEGGYASVIPELCIVCGQCVEVCPNGAKKVRDDLAQARQLLQQKSQVLVSLAPSFVSEFPDLQPGQLVAALRRLGFAGVSETALGAQQVSAQAAALVGAERNRVWFSSACPTVVSYLQKHRPESASRLTGLLSPLLTHCKMLRQAYGPDIGVVFFGPCIAKKLEAAWHPELLDVVLTFADLRSWLEQEKIHPETLAPTAQDCFVPEAAAEGAWYPVDGGMIAGMKSVCAVNDCAFMAFSGIGAIGRAITGLDESEIEGGMFLELLACEGGCVNGPRSAGRKGTAAKRNRVLRGGHVSEVQLPRSPTLDIGAKWNVPAPMVEPQAESQIREALRSVGKFSPDDEMNCGGCGYDSCREFAGALLRQKAERTMCVTYMRKLAQKKANALIQKMPSAVVIVNDAMKIVEFNAAFTGLFAQAQPTNGDGSPKIEGLALAEVMPFASLFHSVLKSGEEILERDLRFQNTILHATIFTIEKHCLVGGIIQDITKPAVQKAQVIRKAQEVIQKQLATTQQIAYLLGENAAESEITLNSIIESFSPPHPDEPKEEHDWRKLYRH
ncbi:MAG TPA: [Fe-Fe] hydrogenase large subunit C-terminal domain-containing protein [Dongiaceae bacterium]|jgi:iron only hydrogenase large subunit-like protein|nr:[Fe-Fe] hydrogenase large subunit C-terminal domain-containing protein [Dongiaceae bacterium]